MWPLVHLTGDEETTDTLDGEVGLMDVLCYTRIREDEQLLLEALRGRGHDVKKVGVRSFPFHLEETPEALCGLDVVVNPCLESSPVGT
jgi:hypothetical protein